MKLHAYARQHKLKLQGSKTSDVLHANLTLALLTLGMGRAPRQPHAGLVLHELPGTCLTCLTCASRHKTLQSLKLEGVGRASRPPHATSSPKPCLLWAWDMPHASIGWFLPRDVPHVLLMPQAFPILEVRRRGTCSMPASR
ncbi:hypothetical protein PIB30_073802 [Stylosanthes scabra]|uniref:Uncharacterized protein n=1 Tax=Stylosanthes scabra TaxID=79078 RepID=A0ABU6SRL8_9FABA|nr:hypothetical protein [Stylosanthes scabra]